MKKALYILMLIAEGLVGFLAMGLVYGNLGWIPCAVTAGIVVVLLALLLPGLKKTTDPALRNKLLTRIALVLLIPTVVCLLLTVYVIVSMLLYF